MQPGGSSSSVIIFSTVDKYLLHHVAWSPDMSLAQRITQQYVSLNAREEWVTKFVPKNYDISFIYRSFKS